MGREGTAVEMGKVFLAGLGWGDPGYRCVNREPLVWERAA